jgi:hypothetical protein
MTGPSHETNKSNVVYHISIHMQIVIGRTKAADKLLAGNKNVCRKISDFSMEGEKKLLPSFFFFYCQVSKFTRKTMCLEIQYIYNRIYTFSNVYFLILQEKKPFDEYVI